MRTSTVTPSSVPRVRKAVLAVVAACACCASVPASAGAVIVGIGDQSAGMFSSPSFLSLNISHARLQVPWNIAVASNQRGTLQAAANWIAAAKQDGVTPLVSFSRVNNSNYIPNVKQYTTAVKAFIHRFPSVKEYTAWNEPDWIYLSLSRKPKLAAAFFNALVRACHKCKVAAGDLYVDANHLKSWLKAYIKGLRFRPKAWALHDYYDVRAHKTSQLKAMLSLTSGPIWLDEISGVVFRGHWQFPKQQSIAAATRDEKYLFGLPRRFHRVTRIYHYQWQASTRPRVWDSALIDADGFPRPAYWVVKKAAR